MCTQTEQTRIGLVSKLHADKFNGKDLAKLIKQEQHAFDKQVTIETI
jgi:hypothetical protein